MTIYVILPMLFQDFGNYVFQHQKQIYTFEIQLSENKTLKLNV